MFVYLLPKEWKLFASVPTAKTKSGMVPRYDLPVLLDSSNADSCYRGMNGSSDSHVSQGMRGKPFVIATTSCYLFFGITAFDGVGRRVSELSERQEYRSPVLKSRDMTAKISHRLYE